MRSLAMIVCVSAFVAVAGCSSSPRAGGQPQYEEGAVIHTVSAEDKAATRSKEPIKADEVVLWVNGLGCPQCATNVDAQLERLPGFKSMSLDLSTGKVVMALQGDKRPSPHQISEAVLDAGFTLEKIEAH
jgi:copper chaperone CopZ